ncbi:MAG: hypothetical protein QOJ30_4719 [Pseudonocardiales bacterium]|nr:hypothetical protein [Pseudonocardiales bacterium]
MAASQDPVRPPVDQALDLLGSALAGAAANDRPDLLERLDAARRALTTARTDGARVGALRATATELCRALDSLASDLRYRREVLADPARAARLRAELARARQRVERARGLSREWPQILGDGFAGLTSDSEFVLRTRSRGVLAEAERALGTLDPAKDAEQLADQLRTRLIAEAEQTYTGVRDGVRSVADRLVEVLELPVPLPVPDLPLQSPSELVAGLSDPRPSGAGRAPIPARLLTVVMPSYGGIMMAVVGTRLLGFQVPGWALAVGAGVGALALGGAALSGERKRGLDRRRGEARTAVRGMVDEFQMALGKQVRDAARAANTHLRRDTTAAFNRMEEDAAAQLTSAKAAVDGLARLPADVADVDDDIATVRDLRRRADALNPRFPG